MLLHQSNKLEILARQLRIVLADAPPPPMQPEIIVVPHQGMAQWVALQLAEKAGIAAQLDFPLPGRFLGDALSTLTGSSADLETTERQALCWRIYDALPQLMSEPAFAPVRSYLHGTGEPLKRYQLAAALSNVFDKYLVYRTDIITRWDQGEDTTWQALLWRQISQGLSHRAELYTRFLTVPRSSSATPLSLPERCCFFGINSLPPIYLELLVQLSRFMVIHFFHLSPCQEYWGDLQSEKEQAKHSSARLRKAADPDAEQYMESGHPLLSSWGAVGRDFLQQLLEYDTHTFEEYDQDSTGTLLSWLQHQLLSLNDGPPPDRIDGSNERSLQLHVCHSPLREVQVLHNRLLDMFQDNTALTAGDILVTAPDIELYAEAIRGVFDSVPAERKIPYYIADSPLSAEAETVPTFLDLLALLRGRCSAPEVMALLESESLRKRFDLHQADLPRLLQWIEETHIRWGLDARHQQEFSGVGFSEHTWQSGLDQLLLGYCMGDETTPFREVYPSPHVTERDADLLGGGSAFLRLLHLWLPRMQHPHSPAGWATVLNDMLSSFFDQETDPHGHALVREALAAFAREAENAAMDTPLPPEVMVQYLVERLHQPSPTRIFLSGRVTFCNMVPMRAVPFKVICVLGISDAAFPRSQQTYSFDKTATAPRRGDRDRRKDDRYLFLEMFLSAREILYLSWTGRDQRDNTEIPPAAVVSELMDHLDRYGPEQRPTLCDQLTTIHPLQPFSRRSFSNDRMTSSYSAEWLPIEASQPAAPFFTFPAQQTSIVSPASIELSDFARFWRHPVRSFLEQRLGMRTGFYTTSLEESEPFALDGLSRFQLRQEITRGLLDDQPAAVVARRLDKIGNLPPAGFGLAALEELIPSSQEMAEQLRREITVPRPSLEVETVIDGSTVAGWIHDLYADGRITWHSARLKGSTLMELWINHLFLNLLAPDTIAPRTVHFSSDGAHVLHPVNEPARLLEPLVALYAEGLSRPIHFFPESSFAAAQAKPGKELQAARKKWLDNYHFPGEQADPAYTWVFAPHSTAPLDQEFLDLCTLFHPLLEHTTLYDAAS